MRVPSTCMIYAGFSAAVLGTTLVILFPVMYDVIFKSVSVRPKSIRVAMYCRLFFVTQLMKVYPGSLSYDIWKEMPIPIYMKVYYWNVTNSEDLEARVPGVKPILDEVGPYVFREEHFKVRIEFIRSSCAGSM